MYDYLCQTSVMTLIESSIISTPQKYSKTGKFHSRKVEIIILKSKKRRLVQILIGLSQTKEECERKFASMLAFGSQTELPFGLQSHFAKVLTKSSTFCYQTSVLCSTWNIADMLPTDILILRRLRTKRPNKISMTAPFVLPTKT